MNVSFFNPTKLIIGEDCVRRNAGELAKLGKSCLIVTSASAAKKTGALDDVTAALDSAGVTYKIYDKIGQNPLLASCVEAGALARENMLEFVIGIGGGSPLDAAKAAAVYAANEMDDGLAIYSGWKNPALPIAAVGTTAGTGSEVTSCSILTKPNGRKQAFGAADTYPRLALGDAKYTATLPLDFTLSTMLDALAHALEAYFNRNANPLTDLFAVEALKTLYPQMELLQSAKSAEDITAGQRERLYYASIAAGYALSQCSTLYCHNLSYYFTEQYHVPHGFACAATLPDLIARGEKLTPERAKALFAGLSFTAEELSGLIVKLTRLPEIKIPRDEIKRLAEEGAKTKNFANTIPNSFTAADAEELLERLFG
jgi:alcohol dehydrogenase class IV